MLKTGDGRGEGKRIKKCREICTRSLGGIKKEGRKFQDPTSIRWASRKILASRGKTHNTGENGEG